MKHTVKITLVIIAAFLVSQLIGLAVFHLYDQNFGKTHEKIVNESIQNNVTLPQQANVTIMNFAPTPIEAKTPIDFVKIIINVLIAIAIAVVLFFVLSRIGVIPVLKGWFAFVVFICLALVFTLILYPFLGYNLVKIFGVNFSLAEIIAVLLALVLTFFQDL